MPSFLRRRSTAAPTVGAPVAAPVATPVNKPPSFGTGLPAAPAPAPGTPSLSDAITQLKGGNRQSAEAMMRQIVGLPPLPVNDIPSPRLPENPGVLQPQPAVPPPNINKPVTTMPVPGFGVAAPYPQSPLGNPAQSPGAMQQYLNQQNLMAQRMNQQPYMPQAGGLNPQALAAYPQNFGLDQQAMNANPQGFQNYMQMMQQREQAMPGSTMLGQQQPYMPQRMTMDMPQTNQPMMQLPTQPMDDGTIMGRATNMMSRAGVFGNPQPIGPQKMAGGYDPIAAERDYYSRMAAQARQPASPQSPFTGNLQDLYAAVAQQQTGMQQPPMGIQQQTFGQTMPTSNMTTDFGPQLLSALGGNTPPPMQQQAFGQTQPPMQQQAFGQTQPPMQQQAFGQTQPPMQLPQQQPMGQFQQNNAQQMSNFQNQSQPAQNTQQNRGGMFGRRFGGGSFGGGGGGGGGGGLF